MRTMRIQDLLAQQALQRDLASDPYGENSQISVDVPQNYMTSSSGNAYIFDTPQNTGPALDYSSAPVEYMGQKGYRLAGDPFTVQLSNGQRLRLGEDTAVTQARNDAQSKRIGSLLANEQTQLENEQKRKALAGNVEPVYGSKAWERIQEDKKARETATASKQSWAKELGDTTNLIDRLIEIDQSGTAKPKSGLKAAAGLIDSNLPTFLEDTSDAESALSTITSRATMDSLSAAKKRVEQSFGSMQVKEWERFENLVRNVKLSNNQNTLAKNLGEMRQWAVENKGLLDAALSAKPLSGSEGQRGASGSFGGNSVDAQQSLFNARKAIQANPSARDAVLKRLQEAGIDPRGL